MAMSGRMWIVMVGVLVALVPAAEAARQNAGKVAKGKPAEAKAGLVVFTDSRGCKLWSSESAAKRMKEFASQGTVTWQGVCKNGFISGLGVLREEGQSVIGGRTRKFAHFLSGTANKGVRTGQWKRESFEKFSDSPNFTSGIATLEFVHGSAVGAPRPVAVTSWSQYSVNFSTRILTPALKEQSLTALARDTRPTEVLADSPPSKRVEPVASPETPVSPPAAPPMAQQQAASLPVPPVTPPPVKPAESAPVATVATAPATAPAPNPAPPPAKAPASESATSSVFSLASALKSALASALGQAPAPAPTPAPAGTTLSAKPVPAVVAAKLPAAPGAAPAANQARELPVKLAAEIPSFVEGQSFSFGSGCYMDTLDGQLWENQVLAVKDQKSIRINGWAVDDEAKMLPEATYLRLENSSGRRFYAATIPEDRPDVAKYLGQAAFVKSGYRALVSAENLPAGEYEAMILMNVGGRNLLCGNGRKLRL